MNLWHSVPLHGKKDDIFHAIVEIPRGSQVKYEYDHEVGALFLDRCIRAEVHYPQNYGFFPQTWNKFDNDPMDVLVFSEYAHPPNTVIPVRVIGIMEMEDTGELDHKILAVPVGEAEYNNITDYTQLNPEKIGKAEWFMQNYKGRKGGDAKITILGYKGAKEALEFMRDCAEEYKQLEH